MPARITLEPDGFHALVGIHVYHGLWSHLFMETKHGFFKTIVQPRKAIEEADFTTVLGAAASKGMADLCGDGGSD
jgi:hypothetical protein